MDANHQDTRDRILQATIDLMSEKGVKAMTTRAIAEEAGVNEVTLFRHFRSKVGLMQAAVEKYSYVSSVAKNFQEKISWNLEEDLYALSKAYQEVLQKNKNVILICFKEASAFPELENEIARIPAQLKKLLMDYLEKMLEKGKVIDTNMEAQAMNFIWVNFGFFISRSRFEHKVTDLTTEEFIKNCVSVFARGLIP